MLYIKIVCWGVERTASLWLKTVNGLKLLNLEGNSPQWSQVLRPEIQHGSHCRFFTQPLHISSGSHFEIGVCITADKQALLGIWGYTCTPLACRSWRREAWRMWSSLELRCQWHHGVDCSNLSAINYNHSSTLFPGTVISLEAFHQHLIPINTLGRNILSSRCAVGNYSRVAHTPLFFRNPDSPSIKL